MVYTASTKARLLLLKVVQSYKILYDGSSCKLFLETLKLTLLQRHQQLNVDDFTSENYLTELFILQNRLSNELDP